MAVQLPNSVFLHIPKTAGNFTRACLDKLGLYVGEFGKAHEANIQTPCFTFAFVREPVAYLRSHWAYRQHRRKLPPNNDPLDTCFDPDFETYVRQLETEHPGRVAALFESYTGWPFRIEFVGKQENVRDDLIAALKAAGESFREDVILNADPINQAGTLPQYAVKLSCEAVRLVRDAEAQAYERYEYD